MSKEKDSIVLNVSEATGKIMEEIQETITSSLFESLKTIKKNVKDCNETCEDAKREISRISQLYERFSTVEAKVKEIVRRIDKKAFLVVENVHEVEGVRVKK